MYRYSVGHTCPLTRHEGLRARVLIWTGIYSPIMGNASESNLASSLFIYLYIYIYTSTAVLMRAASEFWPW